MSAETLLLTLPYYLCALAAYGNAVLGVTVAFRHAWPPRVLFQASAFVLLGTMFFLLAATATQGGYLDRAQMAPFIRWLSLTGGILWLVWLVAAVRAMVRVEHDS